MRLAASFPPDARVPPLDVLVRVSIITTAASTIAPIAIAIPPSDMMFAFTALIAHHNKAPEVPSAATRIATKAERRWNRNTKHTSARRRIPRPA